MPKIVDHQERKKHIAEATWKVILDQGMEGATVRNIAKEAGLSLGALRHYFSSQNDLFIYAMELVKERAALRINKILLSDLPPKEKILQVLLEILPTNEETRVEMEVWFAFVFYVRHKKDVFDVKNDGIFIGMKRLFDYLHHHDILRPNLDIEIETEKLYALIDGLALHGLLEPNRVDKEQIISVLKYHLDSICVDE